MNLPDCSEEYQLTSSTRSTLSLVLLLYIVISLSCVAALCSLQLYACSLFSPGYSFNSVTPRTWRYAVICSYFTPLKFHPGWTFCSSHTFSTSSTFFSRRLPPACSLALFVHLGNTSHSHCHHNTTNDFLVDILVISGLGAE